MHTPYFYGVKRDGLLAQRAAELSQYKSIKGSGSQLRDRLRLEAQCDAWAALVRGL